MPASSKAATAMETSQAASVPETATPVMGSTEAAIHTYGTYTAETHAMMDDAPTSADAHVSEAVITVAPRCLLGIYPKTGRSEGPLSTRRLAPL